MFQTSSSLTVVLKQQGSQSSHFYVALNILIKLQNRYFQNNLEEIKCQSLRKEIKELNGSVRRLGELVSELRIQRSNLEQKLKKTDTQLEENRNKMAELRDELKEEQLKVYRLNYLVFSLIVIIKMIEQLWRLILCDVIMKQGKT